MTLFTAGTVLTAPGQWVSPEALTGALWGGLIGGVAGGNSSCHRGHCHWTFSGEGAALGAGVGLLAGTLLGEARRQAAYCGPVYTAAPAPAPVVIAGYGYVYPVAPGYPAPHGGYAASPCVAPGGYYRPTRPNYAVAGTLLGAASGALIGAGSRQAGEGAAIGAAAGLVLGGVAESVATKQERPSVVLSPQPPPPPAEPRSPPSRNNAPPPGAHNQITSRPGPTSTYYWTPRPQIADAPRVPESPTF